MKHAMKVSFVAFNMIAALVALATSVAMAAETSSIVDTRYMVEAMKRNAIIWDTRSAAAYKQGHIPGAVNIDDIGQVLRDENTEDYIALGDIEKLLGMTGNPPAAWPSPSRPGSRRSR